jgi:hypothetical protein
MRHDEKESGEEWAPRDVEHRIAEIYGAVGLIIAIIGALFLLSLWLSPSHG